MYVCAHLTVSLCYRILRFLPFTSYTFSHFGMSLMPICLDKYRYCEKDARRTKAEARLSVISVGRLYNDARDSVGSVAALSYRPFNTRFENFLNFLIFRVYIII